MISNDIITVAGYSITNNKPFIFLFTLKIHCFKDVAMFDMVQLTKHYCWDHRGSRNDLSVINSSTLLSICIIIRSEKMADFEKDIYLYLPEGMNNSPKQKVIENFLIYVMLVKIRLQNNSLALCALCESVYMCV